MTPLDGSDDFFIFSDDLESDGSVASLSRLETRSDRLFRLTLFLTRSPPLPWPPKLLGNPRSELAAWCSEFIPRAKLARDECFYTKHEH